ncbi:MAG: S8 family serine peptidase [Lachnospiraceae bacterium]|nr:S8 family serine peptidase [Lachnospiraceae bacterium]MDD3617621.1 S8 family serine peptidase [Lachnospiraceae bacterium]
MIRKNGLKILLGVMIAILAGLCVLIGFMLADRNGQTMQAGSLGNTIAVEDSESNEQIPENSAAESETSGENEEYTEADLVLEFAKEGLESSCENVLLKTESGSQVYYRTISDANIAVSETNVLYANDQLIVSAVMGTSYETIENMAQRYDAEISGWIEAMDYFQLSFSQQKSYEEMQGMMNAISAESCVENCYLNTWSENETNGYVPNDPWNGKIDWNSTNGDNWGMVAINAAKAWEYNRYMEMMKVGIVEAALPANNPDLPLVQLIGYKQTSDPDDIKHCYHVAGILAASYDNNLGMNGVFPKANLYAICAGGQAAMEYMGIYTVLFEQNVKVINVSMGHSRIIAFAASMGDQDTINMIKTNANTLSDFFQRSINKGYDFLIVTSAGNGNGNGEGKAATYYKYDFASDAFKKKFNSVYYGGYTTTKELFYKALKTDNVTGKNAVDAKYNNPMCAITQEEVCKHIIVVGAAGKKGSDKVNASTVGGDYSLAIMSNIGDRVDVLAPGIDIVSFGSEKSKAYYMQSGTSQASPIVAGTAAMVWSLDPSLTATEVKQIVVSTADIPVDNAKTNMINAGAAVESTYTSRILPKEQKPESSAKEDTASAGANTIICDVDGYKISLTIPPSWEGKYIATDSENYYGGLRGKFFFEKNNYPLSGGDMGFLFGVSLMSFDEYSSEYAEDGDNEILFSMGDKVWVALRPQDVPSTEEFINDYGALYSSVPGILDSASIP